MEKIQNTESEYKTVAIEGTTNRYLMKKVVKAPVIIQKRKEMERCALPPEYFEFEKQIQLIETMFDTSKENKDYQDIIQSHVNKKLSGYKSQDTIKKIYNSDKFITYQQVLKELYDCKMICHYCNQQMFLLYELVREQKQWTLDRINNDLGHNHDNVIVSCLECNLKRRRTSKEAFSFTQNLTIIREFHE